MCCRGDRGALVAVCRPQEGPAGPDGFCPGKGGGFRQCPGPDGVCHWGHYFHGIYMCVWVEGLEQCDLH